MKSLTYLFVFSFFYFSAHPPDLHSFPTRRSSDLSALWRPGGSDAQPCSFHAPLRGPRVSFVHRHCPGRCVHQRRRSEEHTSELQSRFDLVCRLLLEKKNNLLN